MQGIPDHVQSVVYKSRKTRWMTQHLSHEYFLDRGLINVLSNGQQRHLWIDNCKIHNETPQLIYKYNIASFHVEQHISNSTFGSTVTRMFQIRMAENVGWKTIPNSFRRHLYKSKSSQKCRKTFFLELTKAVIDELELVLIGGISKPCKSLMMRGLIPDVDGVCRREQLTPELQAVIQW